MAALQPLLSDHEFENWVKAGLAIQLTRDGIETFVGDIVDELHQYILGRVKWGNTCNNCTTHNIIKCEQNNNVCKFDIKNNKCYWHDQSIAKRNKSCSLNVCDTIRDEILANHRYKKPTWKNTDARLWCSNKWKIAVCFMSEGYSKNKSAKETDLPGLLNVVINYTYSQKYVADNLSHQNSIFHKTRTSRNEILHNPRQRLTDGELRAHIATFTALLSDAKSLSTDTNAIAAITKLKQIMNNTICITTQHAGQILAEAFNSIKEAVDNVKVLKETTINSIVDKMKEIDRVSDEALKSMKEKFDEITENIKKTVEETGKKTLKRIAEQEKKSYGAIKKSKQDETESITETSKQLTTEMIEKKNELVAEITNTGNKDRTQDQPSSITEIRQKFVSLYQNGAQFLTTPIYPLIQNRNRHIQDLYVPPNMHTVDKETLKQDKKVNSIEDIFSDNSKNIYVVGDAGMGKSALSKTIVSDWCKSQSDNVTPDTLSTDQKAMQKFSFVFYISLRDCYTDLNIIDMIKHQLLEKLYEFDDKILISLLRNEKCLIVLDGLDEWTPKLTPNTSYGSNSPVIIPDRKGVRNCTILTTTRPWKLEAVRLESSQIDRRIQLLGIGEDSHKAFIKHMVKQMHPEIDIDKFMSSFLEEVENKKLNEFLSIPVILKQLICIWNRFNKLRETKTSVYSQMLNLLFEIAQSRLQDNANYKVIKSTENSTKVELPECFAEDKKCKEFVSLLCPLAKLAFETLLSDTSESSLVFEISTTEVHGLTQEQLHVCLDIGILSKTKYLTNQNYIEEHTKINFLHKTYQEFLAALWISLETNEENKQTNIYKFKKKCNTITSMFELSEFLIFLSGMNFKTACELSEHTREITTQSDSIIEYRQSIDDFESYDEVERVQELMISCIKEGSECTHTDSHLYLEDIILNKPWGRDEEDDIAVKDWLIKINKSNIKSIVVDEKCLKSHYGSLLEVSGLEKLMFKSFYDDTIIQSLVTQSSHTLYSLRIELAGIFRVDVDRIRDFKEVGIIQNIRCLTRLHLEDIYLSHTDMLGLMSYISQAHHMKEIVLESVKCECGDGDCSPVLDLSDTEIEDSDGDCSPVLDLSQHGQLECLCLRYINVTIDTVVNVTNMVKCELGVKPVMSFVNVTKSLHKASKLTDLEFTDHEKPEKVCAILECISQLKHMEHLELLFIDFGSNELVLSSDYINLEYVKLHGVTMTKESFRGLIGSILTCNQKVDVRVVDLYIKPVEDIEDILDNVRQISRCQLIEDNYIQVEEPYSWQVMDNEDHKKEKIGRFVFKTIPRQHT